MDGHLRRRIVKLSRTDQSIEVGMPERCLGQFRVPSGTRERRAELCLGITSHRNRPRCAESPGECAPNRSAGASGHSVRELAGARVNRHHCCNASTNTHRTSSSINIYKLEDRIYRLGMHLHLWAGRRPRMKACAGGEDLGARPAREGTAGTPVPSGVLWTFAQSSRQDRSIRMKKSPWNCRHSTSRSPPAVVGRGGWASSV